MWVSISRNTLIDQVMLLVYFLRATLEEREGELYRGQKIVGYNPGYPAE
jgi:hypothetical protein